MSRLKTIGYVVVTDAGDFFMRAPSDMDGRVMLCFGSHASVFATRRIAQQLLARSVRYANVQQLDWPWLATAKIQALKEWS